MKQVLVHDGQAQTVEVPVPQPGSNEILVRVAFSCISPGTERSQVADTSRGSLVGQVLAQPQRVAKALDMLRNEGVAATVGKLQGNLDLGEPIGYSLSGTVVEVGSEVSAFAPGDRVACAGNANAFHAGFVVVPPLLAVRIPEEVGLQQAATVALGAIALQGIRRSEAVLGDVIALIGLGAVGQLTGLLLRRAGCRVVALDLSPERATAAAALGFDSCSTELAPFEAAIDRFTDGQGADAVLVTASTESSEPLGVAARVCRQRGRVVMVGMTGMELDRSEWYRKELALRLSTSYGPGRYDPHYEQAGQDYPYGYVRWTENRNMSAYLLTLAEGMDVAPLVGATYSVDDATSAFADLASRSGARPLALLDYGEEAPVSRRVDLTPCVAAGSGVIGLALVGPGAFALGVHLPNLMTLKSVYELRAIVSRQGHTGARAARRFGAGYVTTDYEDVLKDPRVEAVLIASADSLHVPQAVRALEAGKAVFVEKPMAVSLEQLDTLAEALQQHPHPLMVGFNRRFSPHATRMCDMLSARSEPAILHYRVNAGRMPPAPGCVAPGARSQLVREGCHFIDLLAFLIGLPIQTYHIQPLRVQGDRFAAESNFVATFSFPDGSVADLLYTTIGSSALPKEQIEGFCDGTAFVLNNFRELAVFTGKRERYRSRGMAKGHVEELAAFARCLRSGEALPIAFDEMVAATRITLRLQAELMKEVPDA